LQQTQAKVRRWNRYADEDLPDQYFYTYKYTNTQQYADPYTIADKNANDHENTHAYEYTHNHENANAQQYAVPYAHAYENPDNYENANAQYYGNPYAHADEYTNRDTLAHTSATPWLAWSAGRSGAHWRGGPAAPGRLRTQVGCPPVAGYGQLGVGNYRGR